ncbi:MAG: hypothetical protein A2Z93_08355 [Curvibacter sp. GWA2_64_110]|nr:MAG: hypothetical protein A2Z93_08355 [Curvibacter sp. GWA2_64_110]HCY16323.1 hypothetical protein [Curvibacter sp.]
MRAAHLPLLLVCLAAGLAQAQTAAPAPAEPADKAGRPEPRVETIRHEDTGSRIDELRVGGETKSITVKPKGDAPAYEVGPESNNRNPAAADRERGAGGSGGWKIKSF